MPLLNWYPPKCYIESIQSRLTFPNGVLASGWYKAPHSYMINRTYYCPPFVKMVNFEHSQNLACWFFNVSLHHTSGMSGPGPLGPVGKISVVWSSPEGPQFTRFVGTLVQKTYFYNLEHQFCKIPGSKPFLKRFPSWHTIKVHTTKYPGQMSVVVPAIWYGVWLKDWTNAWACREID